MKVVILAGGLPSSINREEERIPKPMVEIGGRPILWHIMKQYSKYDCHDFIICTGYRGNLIKEYFMDYYIFQSDICVDLKKNTVEILRKQTEDWKVTVVDTGLTASISERISAVREMIGGEAFAVAYGDCISNIDVGKMVRFHRMNKKRATIAAARPAGRNAILPIQENGEITWGQKEQADGLDAWINACNMIFESDIFEELREEEYFLETGLFKRLAQKGEIISYRHSGFFRAVETMRDLSELEHLWSMGKAPWCQE